MKKNTYWIIGGIALVVVIIVVVYFVTRKKPVPQSTVPVTGGNTNPIAGLIGSLGNLFAGGSGGSLNYTSPQDIIDETSIAGGGYN
jgi:hypothetical protein